jgi:hypothetical protein
LPHIHVNEQHAQAEGREDREKEREEVGIASRRREGGGSKVEEEHDKRCCLRKGGREGGREDG